MDRPRKSRTALAAALLALAATGPAPAAAAAPTVARYVMSPQRTIAVSGSIPPGESTTVTLTAQDVGGNAIAGASVYLWLTPALAGGNAAVGGQALTPARQSFTTDASGTVAITYTAPDPLPPYSAHCLENGPVVTCNSTDEIDAAGTAAGPATASAWYEFPAASTVSHAGGTLRDSLISSTTVIAPSDAFTAQVAAGVVPPGAALSVTASTRPPAPLGTLHGVSRVYGLSLATPSSPGGGASLGQALLATIQYDPGSGTPPGRLCVYRALAGGGGQGWQFVPTVADPVTHTAVTRVDTASVVALFVNTAQFSDIPPDYWGTPYIDRLLGAGIVGGFPDGTLQPDASLTRAQFVKMLVLTLGLKPGAGTTPFADVPVDSWFAPYVSAAVDAQLVTGTSASTFAPDRPVSRQEMALLLARALHLSAAAPRRFTDSNAIDTWAAAGVQAAAAAGFIGGFPDGSFRPLDPTTRAQVAKVLAKIIDQRAPAASGS